MPIIAAASSVENIPVGFIRAVGIATVVIALVCVILLCWVVVRSCRKAIARRNQPLSPAVAAPAVTASVSEEIPNRQQFVAAVSAVIAEEMGSDVSKLRILSIKKI